ncbi:MAG: septum formation protein Maf [Deltaproteobacteria bacterium]|nr:MAG: septum formation protein Maf [Deltaproteobacteria bacterium]
MSFQAISKRNPLVLASNSSRRRRLLQQIGLPFLALPSHVEENQVLGEPPVKAALIAEKKAKAVYAKSQNRWILGADTMVVIGASILGKPSNREDVHFMLSCLSGKTHEVITGFCLLDPSGEVAHSEDITTLVKMKPLSEEEIDAYVATGEPFGKAGSYAIQGVGAFMVESISGSYTNVVGLPVCALVKSLLAVGALRNFPLSP